MIIGIGIDIVEVDRLKNSSEKYENRLIERIFTKDEQQYCESKTNKYQHYAVRFAGKEALLKAIGLGLRDGISWQDIEFENDDLGKPNVYCNGKLKVHIDKLNVRNIHVSFSHSKKYGVAVVVLEG